MTAGIIAGTIAVIMAGSPHVAPLQMPGRRVSLGSMPAPSSVASLEPNKTDLSVRRTTSVSAFDFDDLSALRCGSYGAGVHSLYSSRLLPLAKLKC